MEGVVSYSIFEVTTKVYLDLYVDPSRYYKDQKQVLQHPEQCTAHKGMLENSEQQAGVRVLSGNNEHVFGYYSFTHQNYDSPVRY